MTALSEPLGRLAVSRIEDVRPATVLGICASLKPAPGRQGRSAVRSLLTFALDHLANVYPEVALLDLRDHPPPSFDGRMPHDYDDPVLQLLWPCVDRAGALLLAVPAYWSGVSGVFKNFVDVLCGPAYDLECPSVTVFSNKPVGLLVVGAEEASTRAGADQARMTLLATGARLVGQPVLVADPRSRPMQIELVSRELAALAGELAQHAYGQVVREGP